MEYGNIIALDFGDFNNLAPTTGSVVDFDNSEGFSTIGVTVTVPTGGSVAIKGSFDNNTFLPILLKDFANDHFVNSITGNTSLVGSINTLRTVRFETSVSGSASGSVVGKVSRVVSVLEGLEQTQTVTGNVAISYFNPDYAVSSMFADLTDVASGIDSTIIDYTVPSGNVFYLSKVEFGGSNIAEYELLIDAVASARKRTNFGAPLSDQFDFMTSANIGIRLESGQNIKVNVNHQRPSSGDFEARILGVLSI